MAIITITTQRLQGGTWQVTATSDLSEPTYYWYRDGLLVDVTQVNSRLFDLTEGDLTQIDVLDDADTLPGESYPARCVISTAPGEGVVKSRVEELVDGEWVTRHTTLGSYVGYQTRVLADGETAQYRVVPVNEAGIDGSPRTFTVTMVRRPDPPDVDYTWDDETARVTLALGG